MRRALTAVTLSLAIPLGALSAPLLHAHSPLVGTDHHDAPEIHAHWGGHTHGHGPRDGVVPGGVELDDRESEGAVSLQLFVAVAQASFDVPPAVVASVDVEVPAEAAAHDPLRVVHGHDPPSLSSTGSRAPPPFLS
ncbi:MAG: hypothetical protein O2930_02465 [Acidobacteria bacterium]|nr:hypothetical protein [Acidobacteriota bacterium]